MGLKSFDRTAILGINPTFFCFSNVSVANLTYVGGAPYPPLIVTPALEQINRTIEKRYFDLQILVRSPLRVNCPFSATLLHKVPQLHSLTIRWRVLARNSRGRGSSSSRNSRASHLDLRAKMATPECFLPPPPEFRAV